MKKLFSTIVMSAGFAALATACGGGSSDLCPNDPAKIDPGFCGCGYVDVDLDADGALDCDAGTISVTWNLVEGDDNTPAACPANYQTIAVISTDSAGGTTTDLYDCGDGGGVTAPLPEDAYLVWIKVTDDTGNVLYAQSLSTDTSVVQGYDTPLDFEISLDRGAFYLAWETWLNGEPSDCASVGGEFVSVLATDENDDFYDDLYDCTDYAATTAGLPARMGYTTSVSLLDSAELAIDVADAMEVSLDYGNHYYDLGTVIFDVAL